MKLEGFSNYEIYPETGQVWSYISNRFIGSKDKKDGYWRLGLKNDKGVETNWLLHRLIWGIVNGVVPNGMQVNHIDENKDNNSIVNLNLMTPKENTNWGTGTERMKKNQPKRTPVLAIVNNTIQKYYPSLRNCGSDGFAPSLVGKCAKGEYKQAYGYEWQYQDDYLADWWEQEMEKALN